MEPWRHEASEMSKMLIAAYRWRGATGLPPKLDIWAASPPNQYTPCTYGADSAAPGTAPCIGLTDYSFPQNAWARSERSATWASDADAPVPRRPLWRHQLLQLGAALPVTLVE